MYRTCFCVRTGDNYTCTTDTMSIQASDSHYCRRNDDGSYASVEIGFPSAFEILLDDYTDDYEVYGYVPLDVVDAVIAKHGGILLIQQ